MGSFFRRHVSKKPKAGALMSGDDNTIDKSRLWPAQCQRHVSTKIQIFG
jgi:hypothetical protein